MIRIDEIIAGRPWLLLLVQGTACLAAGLAASYVLRHRPARAHQVLLTALLASVLMPTLYLAAGHYRLGLLAPKPAAAGSTPAVARASCPWTSDLMDSPAPAETRPGWPRDARAGRPRHGGWATDIRLLPDLPTTEVAAEPTLPEVEPIRAIPASPAKTIDLPWSRIAILGWSVITTILLLRLIWRFALGLRLLRVGHPLESEPLRRAVDGARSRLGVTPPVGIRCSERVHSPVIWCWGREPILLMQKAASDGPNGTDWVGVFCHELAHWRRRDHLTGLFAELLAAVLPWHPLLWWARGRLLKLSEQACDDWVLATGQNGVDYAEMLLGLAAERQMAFLPTVIGKEKTMHTRIRRIIQDNGSDPRLGTGWALVVGALALCTTVGVAVAQRRPAGPEPMDPPPTKIVKERREIEVREPPGTDQQRIAMKRVLERLMKQADEKKEMLAKGNELPEEERLAQQIEIKLLVEQIEQMKNRLEAPGRAPVKIAPKKPFEPEPEARFDALRQGHEELEQRAQKLEREIKGLRDGQDQEARELKSQLERIRDKKVLVEKEMDELKLAPADDLKRKKLDEIKRAQAEVRREIVVRKPAAEEQDREELLQHARLRAEKLARMLQEDPATDTEEARTRRKLLDVIQAEINALEQEPRGLDGTKEAPGVAPKREYRIIKEEVKIEKKAPDGPPRVVKGPAAGPRLETRVYTLKCADPQKIRGVVETLVGKLGIVAVPADQRKLAVNTTTEYHRRLERLLPLLDVPQDDFQAPVGGAIGTFGRLGGTVGQASRSEEIVTQMFKLGRSNAVRLRDALRPVFDKSAEISADERTNSLIVAGTKENVNRVRTVITEIDTLSDGPDWETEIEELRSRMRGLTEQMRQIQDRLDWMAEQEESGQADEPADRPPEYKIEH